ncbi:MAG: plasmid mobilization relaxosome protein MobC [Ruminococcus sp.]|nr:plasmid mobilization relaxosome protein MobC [Ruminococcus sp.]
MENDSRNHKISFRMNDEEYEIFMDKFLKSKAESQGKFIRKMLLNGLVLHFDKNKAKTAFRLISNIASNINQIALRVNSTGNIYAEDISEIHRDINELWRQQRYFQSELQKFQQ